MSSQEQEHPLKDKWYFMPYVAMVEGYAIGLTLTVILWLLI